MSAKNLRVAMAERDVNTQELAYMTGLSVNTISRLRSGTVKQPQIETARTIAKALRTKIEYIWPSL